MCSKQQVKNEQFLVPTNHFFEVTIAIYIPLAFRKCILSHEWCNSSPKSHSPRNCVHFLRVNQSLPDWCVVLILYLRSNLLIAFANRKASSGTLNRTSVPTHYHEFGFHHIQTILCKKVKFMNLKNIWIFKKLRKCTHVFWILHSDNITALYFKELLTFSFVEFYTKKYA